MEALPYIYDRVPPPLDPGVTAIDIRVEDIAREIKLDGSVYQSRRAGGSSSERSRVFMASAQRRTISTFS